MKVSTRSIIVSLAMGLVVVVIGLAYFGVRSVLATSRNSAAANKLQEGLAVRFAALGQLPAAEGIAPEAALPFHIEYLQQTALAVDHELGALAALRVTGPTVQVEALDTLLTRYRDHLEAVALRSDAKARLDALNALVNATRGDLRSIGLALGQQPSALDQAGTIAHDGGAAAYLSQATRPLRVSTLKTSYGRGEQVLVKATNMGEGRLELPSTAPLVIYRETSPGEWQRIAGVSAGAALTPLGPGEFKEWAWDGRVDGGQPAPAGSYEARVVANGWREYAFFSRFEVK